MSYIESRNSDLRDIHSVYSHDISSFICKYADLPDLTRVSNISKNGGVELSKFNVFPYRYNRLDHSFGMAVILENFKQDQTHVFEALIHEIAKPSFSYSVDYLKKYFKIKDFVEPTILEKITSKELLGDKDFLGNIVTTGISQTKPYSLGFADYPYLSANTLEFILANSYFTRLYELRDVETFYKDISVCRNEEDNFEFCFSDLDLAYKFFRLSIELGKKNRSYEAKITRQLIADVIMLMIRREEITLSDLFKYSDKAIEEIGLNCTDKRIQEGWQMVRNLNKVQIKFNAMEDSSNYCVKVPQKSIYIDPLVKTKAGTYRLSRLDGRCEKDLDAYFSTDTDMFMYIDYEL